MRTIEDADDAGGGSSRSIRQRNGCSFSSSVGALKALILTPGDQPSRSRAGSLRPPRCPFPAESPDLLRVCFGDPAAGVEPLLQITQSGPSAWVKPVRLSCPGSRESLWCQGAEVDRTAGSRSSSVND